MSNLTSRLSKAVFDYLETANLRQEPFSLSRVEEVIAGVMATERKAGSSPITAPEVEYTYRQLSEQYPDPEADASRSRQAALEQYLATIRGRTELRIAPNESLTGFLKRTDPAQLQEPTAPVTCLPCLSAAGR